MSKNNLKGNSDLIYKSLQFIIFRIGGVGFGYLFAFLITRNFGDVIYGLITLATTFFMIFSVVSKFGFDINIIKTISNNDNSSKNAFDIYLKISFLSFLFASLLSVFLIALKDIIALKLFNNPEFSTFLFWGSLAIPFWTITIINSGVLRGLEKNALFSFFLYFGRYGLTCTILIFYLFIYDGQNAVSPLIIHSIVSFFLFSLSTFLIIKKLKSGNKFNYKENKTTKDFIIDSYPIFVSSVIFIVLGWSDRIILGVFSTEENVALFDISVKIALSIGFVLEAFNSILAPKISKLYHQKKITELRQTIQFSTKIISAASLTLFFVIIIFGELLLNLFDLNDGYSVLIILSAGQIINCFCGSVGLLLQMTGNQKFYRKIMVFALFLNLTLNVILVRLFGVIGVAYATSLSLIFWNVLGVIIVKRKLNIWSFYIPFKVIK